MYLLPLKLRRGDRDVLESWTRSGTIEARLAKRARIMLMAAEGTSNRDIADVVGMHYNQVGLWRKRYGELGLAGLVDEERPGRPCVYDHDYVLLLVKTVTEEPPGGATRWTMEALAQAMSAHGVPADLQGVGPETLAGRELDDKPRPRLLGKGGGRVRPLAQPATQRHRMVRRREDLHPGQGPNQPGPARSPRRPRAA
jgi:transposase